jgi:hypothetical protein
MVVWSGVVSMQASIGKALLVATLTLSVSAQVVPAAAEPVAATKPQVTSASDAGARRYHRHDRYATRPNTPYPMYYGRPVYYAPAPFLPIPPLWGYGWEWW